MSSPAEVWEALRKTPTIECWFVSQDAGRPGLDGVILDSVFGQAVAAASSPKLERRVYALGALPTMGRCDVLILAGVDGLDAVSKTSADALHRLIAQAALVVATGESVKWLASSSWGPGNRLALHWEDSLDGDDASEDVIVSPAIIEHSDKFLTCCGGAATFDLALLIARNLFGPDVHARVRDVLCVDRVREPGERQKLALQARFGTLVPKLAEAVALMEANIEEPLQAEEIARLIDISRRQLERLFKQHLHTVPSRYYLDIRLQRARRLLRESSYSLVHIGLMCGFSSGAHFSTTYSTVFGITPREERQRYLKSAASEPKGPAGV